MGIITIHFHNRFLDLYESEIVDVTDRRIGNVNGEMSITDTFGLFYRPTDGNSVLFQHINIIEIDSWDYYPCTSCEKAESHYKETDDPVFENLRKKLQLIANNNKH